MIVAVLAASVILCSWSLMFGRSVESTWMDRTETRWLLAVQLALLLLASISPNPWVGFTIAWIAVHPWIALLGFNYGPLKFHPARGDTYKPLLPVLWWSVVYITLSNTWQPGWWSTIAWTLVVWSIVNILAAIYQKSSLPTPSWWKDGRSPEFPNPAGLVGGTFMLAWITAMGSLSATVLLKYESGIILYMLIAVSILLSVFSWNTGTRSPVIATSISLFAYASVYHSAWYILLAIPAIAATVFAAPVTPAKPRLVRIGMDTAGRYLVPPWRNTSFIDRWRGWSSAIVMILMTWGMGTGLGMWAALSEGWLSDKDKARVHSGIAHSNLHNDWLQSAAELGVVPVICSAGLLISTWLSTPSTPDSLFGLLLLTSIAMYALWYFPMHDHAPSILMAASIAMIGR